MPPQTQFPGYAKFLRTKLLKELAKEELTTMRQLDVPLLGLLSLKPEAEIIGWLAAREEQFLEAIEAGTGKEWELERVALWEQDAIPGIPKGGLQPSDVILFHTAQRTAFLRFVARYAVDQTKKVTLLSEIDAHFMGVLNDAMQAYQRMSRKTTGV